jgi:hypothetical protein
MSATRWPSHRDGAIWLTAVRGKGGHGVQAEEGQCRPRASHRIHAITGSFIAIQFVNSTALIQYFQSEYCNLIIIFLQ